MVCDGCKKEDPILAQEPEQKEITEAKVGTSGGVLKTEALQVTIPAGAFSSEEDIHLTELSEESIFGAHSRSGCYKIDGLPETFEIPIKITIAYQGTLSGESFLLVGEEGINPETGEVSVIYNFLPAADSSGHLIAHMKGIDGETTAKSVNKSSEDDTSKKWITVESISDFFSASLLLSGDSCKMYVPAENKDAYSPMIEDYLENALRQMNIEIFTGIGAANVNIKSVFFANLSGEDYCRFAWRNGSKDGRKKPKGVLAVNINKLDDGDHMRIMVGREVLRSFLFTFDPQYPHMRSPDEIPHHWLNQAVLTWSETEFAHE